MFFVAKICKRALRASIEGYLAVAASTPTYSSLAGAEKDTGCARANQLIILLLSVQLKATVVVAGQLPIRVG